MMAKALENVSCDEQCSVGKDVQVIEAHNENCPHRRALEALSHPTVQAARAK
jgi:hypothetical protein